MVSVRTAIGIVESARRQRVEPTSALGGTITKTDVQRALEDLDTAVRLITGVTRVLPITGNSTTYLSSQIGAAILRSNAGTTMTDTLPGTSPGQIPVNGAIDILNFDTVALLVVSAGAGATIDGGPFIILGPGQGASVISDGTNYFSRHKPSRIKLRASTSFYVDSAGSNANSGVSPGSAWATPQYAWDYAQANIDAAGQQIIPRIAAGTYTGAKCEGNIPGVSTLNPFLFAGSGSASCFINAPGDSAFKSYNGAAIGITNLQIFGTYGCLSLGGGYLSLQGNDTLFNTCDIAQMNASYGGVIEISGNYSIGGNCPQHALADSGATIVAIGRQITLIAAPSFPLGMLLANTSGNCTFQNITMAGSGIGVGSKKYDAFENGVVKTSGTWAVPGGVAGTTSTGGQFT